MVFQLTKKIAFPDPHLGEESGIFAVGGDLSVRRLLLAYQHGIFPWYDFRAGQRQWWCPMQRFVIFPHEIHVSHSMRTLLNKGKYTFSFNKAFDRVIQTCSHLRYDEPGAWLGEEVIEAYTELHKLGYCSSVEVWEDDTLVGGLYGVTIGKNFFGESMFSLVPSGSKMALIFLARFMEQRGMGIIDCQFETPHLKTMGGRYISYDEYLDYVNPEAKNLYNQTASGHCSVKASGGDHAKNEAHVEG
jgi:leucyl/phenylalanyl-tRNA--protein transferase